MSKALWTDSVFISKRNGYEVGGLVVASAIRGLNPLVNEWVLELKLSAVPRENRGRLTSLFKASFFSSSRRTSFRAAIWLVNWMAKPVGAYVGAPITKRSLTREVSVKGTNCRSVS